MAEQWWDFFHNKLYSQPWMHHSLVYAEPYIWSEHLNPVPMKESVAEQKDAQPGTPHVTNFNIAASRLKRLQINGHKSDVPPPPEEESSTSWLGKHKDGFVQVKRLSAFRRRRPSVQRRETGGVAEGRQKQRRNTVDRLLNLGEGVIPPRVEDRRDVQQGSDILGPIIQWRNRAYRVRKRVGDFLGRAGARVYPTSGLEGKQLNVFEAEINQHEDQHQQQQQQQVSESELAKLGEATPATNQAQEHQETSDNSGNTAHQATESLLGEFVGEEQARILEERLRRLRGEDAEEGVRSSNTAPAAPAPPPPPKTSGPRPFHIAHVAHLAPSYIAAQQSRRRAQQHHPTPPPSPQQQQQQQQQQQPPHHRTGSATTTACSNTQVDAAQLRTTTQPLWEGAKGSREIWFGVGSGTGRDVGGRKGEGRRV
ncbi:hypothetical protein F4814DRAFT_456593 [Daldinia grandis]|nr:hypothetical protein F4814DRAFT_456593 [Daldinia grandis]